MTKVLLDTTYLLPSAGIAVEGVPADAIRRIRAAGNEVMASEMSFFEVLAKGAKLASQGKADPDRISLAIKSVLSDGSIGKVAPFSEDVVAMAIELRARHADFVDCMIIASAATQCDALVTEDVGITKNDELMKAVHLWKPEFRVLTLKSLLAGLR